MRIFETAPAHFEAWGRFVVGRPWLVLSIIAALSAYAISWLPQLTMDNSVESLLRPSDPGRKDYDAMRDQFGQDERVVITIRPEKVFDLAFLDRLRALHREIENEIPHVLDVVSLINARSTRGDADELIVEDLMEAWPETPEDLRRLEARVRENPLYEDTIVNAAGTLTTLIIEPFVYSSSDAEDALAGFDDLDSTSAGNTELQQLLTEQEKAEQVVALEEMIDRFQTPDLEIYLTGHAVVNHHVNLLLMRDVQVFMSASLLLITVLLFVVFRRASGVILPILTVVTSLLVTQGIMAWIGIPTSSSGQILPLLLITVGICNAIHILAIVYQRIESGEEAKSAIVSALGHSGPAVMIASLTTAGGLFSFVSAELAQIANLGKMAPLGIVLTFFYSVTMLPALLAIFPPANGSNRGGDALRRFLGHATARAGDIGATHPWPVLAVTAGILIVFGTGLAQIRFSQDMMKFFPESDPRRIAFEFVDQELSGITGYDFIIDTGRENGLHDPDVMRRIERAMRFAEAHPGDEIWVSKATSIVDVVKEIHKALNGNQQSYYALPAERELLAQELLLFENSGTDDLEGLVDSELRLARVSLRSPHADGVFVTPFVDDLKRGFEQILGDDITVQPVGLGVLFGRTFAAVTPTLARSYMIALLIITPLMIVIMGSFRMGLLAMLPNLIPIWLTLGLMGWLDIPLDNSSLLVGCIIIGLAVDDTIHFMHKFRAYFAISNDSRLAIRQTLETTGTALVFTSVVLSLGFAVLALCYLKNTADIGILCAFGTVVAFLADITVSPALMVLATRSSLFRTDAGELPAVVASDSQKSG